MSAPRISPSKNLLFLSDRTLVTRRENPQGGYTVIKTPPPEDLAVIAAAVDGRRTLDEVCAALADSYDAETVREVITGLSGLVFDLDEPSLPTALATTSIGVVGGGQLAIDLATSLAPVARITLLWFGAGTPTGPMAVERVPLDALAERLRAFPVVVAAHSGGPFTHALEVNRAALTAGTLCLHAVAEHDTIVIGPSTVPFKTSCLECSQINWYFENHAADQASEAIARQQVPEIESAATSAALVTDATRRIANELVSLVTGTPHPEYLGVLVRVSLAHGTKTHDLIPTTNCNSCFGCNRQGIRVGVSADAIPELPALERRPLIADRTGGVRSVELPEARRRAEAAMRAIGVDMEARGYSRKVRQRYPELHRVPFYSMEPRLTFRRDAELMIARPPEQCFGKGANAEQTMCSAMFEFLERGLHMYRGGVDIVRAPYSAVRAHAIDMEAFTRSALAIPDAGSRVRFDPDLEIDWCWARSLRSGRSVLVPAHSLYAGIVSGNDRHPSFTFRGAHIEMPRRGSSGLSAGATREDSVLQGLYEVIEHDQRLLHYRSGIPAPAIDQASITEPLTRQLLQNIDAAGFDLTLRYLSRDIKIPVVEAYLSSRRDYTFYRVPGWGAHHDPAIAIRRAVTECVQCIGAAESVASQTFQYGIYALTNSFHEDRYCITNVDGTVRFEDLPRANPSWSSALDYLEAAIADVTRALPDAELAYFEYPSPGLDGIFVTAVFATHVICNLRQGSIVQDRVLDAKRIAGHGDDRVPVHELFLGELKI